LNNSHEPTQLSPQGFAFLTNHAYVLTIIALRPDVRMREIAASVGITERAVQRIVDDLTTSGVLQVSKSGRRNRYGIRGDAPLGHPLSVHRSVADLIRMVHPGFVENGATGTSKVS